MKYKTGNNNNTKHKRQTSKLTQNANDTRIIAQDLFNSYAFTTDVKLKTTVENAMFKIFKQIHQTCLNKNPIYLWVDGSYNPDTKTAGVGIIIITDLEKPIDNKSNIIFGKTVKAKDSLTAEIYALSIGLSYILDTFADTRDILIRYDCINSTICATNINSYVSFGAPYTNFKSALKRVKKRKINVVFEHTKAHMTDSYNTQCDLLARYYSKASLKASQVKQIQKLINKK